MNSDDRARWVFEQPLVTERLVLRPFGESDLEDLYSIQSRADVVRFIPYGVRSKAEVVDALAKMMKNDRLGSEQGPLAIAVERTTDHRLIGSVTLWRDPEHRQGEVGYLFHPDAQGHGYAVEAVTAALDLAFGPLGVHRVYARVDARNRASAALASRLGMRQEAHLRENEWFKGEWSDELVFAILAAEWAAAGH
jgi:RimJ/RimL family protein N-acetyltransferase